MLLTTQLAGLATGSSGAAAFPVNAVFFNGTTSFLTRDTGLTGAVDSKLWTGSFWIHRVVTGTEQYIHHGDAGLSFRAIAQFNTTNNFRLIASNALDAVILEAVAGNMTDTKDWHHIIWAVDLANPANRFIYIDDVLQPTTWVTYTNDLMDFTRTQDIVGARADGTLILNADIAELWIANGQYFDISVVANRRKFITARGCPVDLGVDGSKPTGTAPIMYFSGPTAAWHTNKGTGGGFSLLGGLIDAVTEPCD